MLVGNEAEVLIRWARERATAADRRRETRAEQRYFAQVRRAELGYIRQLRYVARYVGEMVRDLVPPSLETFEEAENLRRRIDAVLGRYAESLRPWAEAVAERVLADVMRRDERAWRRTASQMSRALGEEVRRAPTGEWYRAAMAEQVTLITSLPIEAARRVHERVIAAQQSGARASSLVAEILETGQVTRSRAELIARTETGRASTELTKARAIYIGADSYVWETSQDADVRTEHRKLSGRVFKWSEQPPIAGPNGQRYHAGAGPNCRCWPRPLVPDEVQ